MTSQLPDWHQNEKSFDALLLPYNWSGIVIFPTGVKKKIVTAYFYWYISNEKLYYNPCTNSSSDQDGQLLTISISDLQM